MRTASDVAKQIILLAQSEDGLVNNLSPLKLQKLLFYSQAWYAANKDERLFDDDIVAWKHGPVIEEVYHEYKEYGSQDLKNITVSAKKNASLAKDLRPILEVYGNMSPYELVARTHEEEVWRKNYQALNKLIPFDQIKRTFKLQLVARS